MRIKTYFILMIFFTLSLSGYSQLNIPFENMGEISRSNAVTMAPTITLTDVTNPTLNTFQGLAVNQTLNISGVNLSANLSLAITGTDAGLFSLSQNTITQTAGNVPNTILTITYSPLIPGSNSATLLATSSGAMPVVRILTGNSAVQTELTSPSNSLIITVENGNLLVKTNAGETIEVFNTIGEKLISTLSVEGMNTIPLKVRGVLIVKVGNRVAKVIN